MNVICRHAEDDFRALLIAQGMENAGALVFSIANNGSDQYPTALIPHTRFIVWAKYEPPLTPCEIDKFISEEEDTNGR